VVTAISRAWLYVRTHESVRIVLDGGNVAVYGPGPHFSHSRFSDEIDAAVHHAALEDALVRNGWTLEQLTTERRSGADRREAARRTRGRRRHLRLVDKSSRGGS
jgi:hypothetical protein